ncbi:MAG: DNA protecting protein DprA [Deltaproteobacteria bacterium RIFCSPHIGHO2_12_FULL_43_9]|nr:MAG: DNA protecting protein DprA [Deltaproteobacteria bacterium RIFCSPHIGHO2_12_FULL_43_9]
MLHYFVALNNAKHISPKLAHRLIEHFSSPEKIFSASREELQVIEGITSNALNSILNFTDHQQVIEEIARAESRGITLIPWGSEHYPELLSQIYDPPVLLYVKGSISPDDKIAIALVGARKASSYGLKAANRLASELAANKITLVSGMARGIDTEIHRTALKNGGRTIAVLGSGLEFIYPPENRELYNEISRSGAVISEFPLLTPPEPYNFPRRNRIISGLSLGTVVVEAGEKSGSLITARFALDQGREVFAVPGPIGEIGNTGTHRLIQDGAKLVQNTDDILTELNIPKISKETNITDLSDIEKLLLDKLEDESYSINSLAGVSGIPANAITAAMTKLELRGLVREIHGNRFVKET